MAESDDRELAPKPSAESTPRPGKKRRRWLLYSIAVISTPIVLYAVARGVFEVWCLVMVPSDAPRIAISLSDTWLNDLGVTRSTYELGITRVGGAFVFLEPDDGGGGEDRVDPQAVRDLLEDVDGVLLSGGGDVDPRLYGGDPENGELVDRLRDDFELALIREARRRGLPVLGICRGCQILNVSCGGTLRTLRRDEALAAAHFSIRGHAVDLEPRSRLAEIFGRDRLENVDSFHGQAVQRPGTNARVAARSEDGVIEAIELGAADGAWIIGVQWHPELEWTVELFEAFVEEARRAREERDREAGRP